MLSGLIFDMFFICNTDYRLSLHSGTTTGDIKMNFGRCEGERYRKFILPIYGDFLRKCYCKSLTTMCPWMCSHHR